MCIQFSDLHTAEQPRAASQYNDIRATGKSDKGKNSVASQPIPVSEFEDTRAPNSVAFESTVITGIGTTAMGWEQQKFSNSSSCVTMHGGINEEVMQPF